MLLNLWLQLIPSGGVSLSSLSEFPAAADSEQADSQAASSMSLQAQEFVPLAVRRERFLKHFEEGQLVDLSAASLFSSAEDGAFFWAPSALVSASTGLPNVNGGGLFWALGQEGEPVFLMPETGELMSAEEVEEMERVMSAQRGPSTPPPSPSTSERLQRIPEESPILADSEVLLATGTHSEGEGGMDEKASLSSSSSSPHGGSGPAAEEQPEARAQPAAPEQPESAEKKRTTGRNKFAVFESDSEEEGEEEQEEEGSEVPAPSQVAPSAPVKGTGKRKPKKSAASGSAAPPSSLGGVGRKWSLNRLFEDCRALGLSLSISLSHPSPSSPRLPNLSNLKKSEPFDNEHIVLKATPGDVLNNDKVGMTKVLDPLAASTFVFQKANQALDAAHKKGMEDPEAITAFSLTGGISGTLGKGKASQDVKKGVQAKGFLMDKSMLLTTWDERVTRTYISEADTNAGFEAIGFLVTPDMPESQLVNLMENMDVEVTVAASTSSSAPEGRDPLQLLTGTGSFEPLFSSKDLARDPRKAAALLRKVAEGTPGNAVWVFRTSKLGLFIRMESSPSGVLRVVYVSEMTDIGVMRGMLGTFDGSQFIEALPKNEVRLTCSSLSEKKKDSSSQVKGYRAEKGTPGQKMVFGKQAKRLMSRRVGGKVERKEAAGASSQAEAGDSQE